MSASREKRLRRELRDAEANSDTVKKQKKKQNNLMEKKTVIQCKNGKAQNHCFLHRI